MPVETAAEPFGNISRQMNKLMDQMQKGFFTFSPNETWTPNVNLYESETSYVVCVDLSGVVKEDIDIQVHHQIMTLKGRRDVPAQPPELTGAAEGSAPQRCRVHLMEIDHGQFSREVELPRDIESDQINAIYRNGLLWIDLPKKR